MKNPNKYGTVFKMSGARRKPWRVRKMVGRTEKGNPIYINIGYTETHEEGMIMLAQYNINPWDINPNKVTFAEVHQMYTNDNRKDFSQHTINSRKTAFNNLKPIHHIPIRKLKTQHFQEIVDSMETQSSSKKIVKTLALAVYDYALQNDIVEKDYAQFIKIDTKHDEKEERVIFTYKEIRDIFNTQNSIRHDILKILLCSGFRISEVLQLKTKNIHLDKGYVIGGSKTEAGIDRLVPISRHTKKIIEHYYNEDNVYLFASTKTDHQKYPAFAAWFRRNIKGHKIHDTRHTFITIFNKIEANELRLKRIVGHKSMDITKDVYTHTNIEELKHEMFHFDNYMETIII